MMLRDFKNSQGNLIYFPEFYDMLMDFKKCIRKEEGFRRVSKI